MDKERRKMTELRETLSKLLSEVARERIVQNSMWGGAVNDYYHSRKDWCNFIEAYTKWAWMQIQMQHPNKYRERMVQVAALAVAAIESHDRKMENTPKDPI